MGGVTEDLSARLAQSCPAYFKEDDKIFYEASGLLRRAEAATAAADKDHLTRSALKLMMKVHMSWGSKYMSVFQKVFIYQTEPVHTARRQRQPALRDGGILKQRVNILPMSLLMLDSDSLFSCLRRLVGFI